MTCRCAAGAKFGGQELYERLRSYLAAHVTSLRANASGLMDETLLNYYLKNWDSYEHAGKVISHLANYLNRNWIKRQLEEKKRDVYPVYTVRES